MIVGGILVTALVAAIALISGRHVHSTRDFTVAGRRAGWQIVAGIIVGALVGGSSTVGTAQAAFVYGLPAWWFTLGAGLGCLVLACFFAKPLRLSNVETLPQFLVGSFGGPMRPLIAVCDSIGIFMTIPGQVASGIALLAVLLPWPHLAVVALIAVLIILYVFTGGAISAGIAGFAKLLIAFSALIVFGVVALYLAGGVGGLEAALPGKYFDLFGNGVWKDLGSGVGIILGVLTTQVYVQAVLAGRTVEQSRLGTVVAGLGTIIFGLGGVAVGMFMKVHEPDIRPAEALPLFAAHYFPGLLSGMLIGAILITVITCAGGLALGIATMVTRDLYQHYLRPDMRDGEGVGVARTIIVAVVVLGVLVGASNVLLLIINYSFLAFAFRADAILVPLIVAIFFTRSRLCCTGAGIGAVVGGMLVNIGWSLAFPGNGAAVFAGLAGSVAGLFIGYGAERRLRAGRKPAETPLSGDAPRRIV
ncbi:MAG TPA: sodium:solute symporter family protein [Aliidongia sp.]|nr:sodium:solute symporter family protein [Aliidongia sp.]